MLTSGQVISQKYRIDRLLGAGGMGAVYVATNLVLEKRVALKVMGGEFVSRPDWVQRFFREGVAASKVRHPGVVQVFDAGEHEGAPWMAMELLEGESLREKLEREGRIGAQEVTYLARQVLGALAAVHAVGVVHRDLKPDNIFLENTPDGVRAKVLDFGIAKESQGITSLTATGTIVGTAHYLAPEQARDSRTVDPRSDLYAMGVIVFESLSGQMPYEAETVPELIAKMYTEPPRSLGALAPGVPLSLQRIVHACLAREPNERPASAQQMLEMLDAATAETMPGTRAHTGPVSGVGAVWSHAGALAPSAQSYTPAPYKTELYTSSPSPPAPYPSAVYIAPPSHAAGRKSSSFPFWLVGGVLALLVVGGGMVALVAVIMAGVSSFQRAVGGGGGSFFPSIERTLWDSSHAPIVADANGDGAVDVVGSVNRLTAQGELTSHFAVYDGRDGRQLWMSESLGSSESRHPSSTTVAGNTLLYASSQGTLHGYDLASGRPRWNIPLGERVAHFCAADAAHVVVVTTDERRTDVSLGDGSARPAPSGTRARLRDDGYASVRDSGISSSWEEIDTWNEDVDVEGMSVDAALRDPNGGALAIGQRNIGTRIPMVAHVGTSAWRLDVPNGSPLSAEADGPATGAIEGRTIFLAYTMNQGPAHVTAVEIDGGRRLWDTALTESHFDPSNAVVAGDLLVLALGASLVALNARDGSRRFVVGE
jgi:serine/threonine protein kinase/outer membrane protein assembly factor BamB